MEMLLSKRLAKSSIAIVASAVIFTGCGGGGGGSSAPTTTNTTYSGSVADGYISGATVCLDINANGTCDSTEPTATTDANGGYTISTTATIPAGTKLIASGGTDTYTNQAFTGTLISPIDLKDGTKNHLNPLTTLVASSTSSTTTTQTALNNVATELGIDASMIQADPFAKLSTGTVDEQTKAGLAVKKAYVVQKTAEILKNANPTKSSKEIYEVMASNSSEIDDTTGVSYPNLITPADLTSLVSEIDGATFTKDNIKAKQKAIDVIKEIVNANGVTTITGLLSTLDTAIADKNVDIKAFAHSLKGVKTVDSTTASETVTNTETSATATTKTVTIDFDAVVGNEKLLCSEEINGENIAKEYTLGKADTKTTIADFRYFVSNIKLILSDGTTAPLKLFNNSFQYQVTGKTTNVAILDFEDKTGNCYVDTDTNKSIVGTIPSTTATITGIEFMVGVPLELNHVQFPDAKALTKTGMVWSWQSGRKFTKLETQPVAGLDSYNATTSAWTNSKTGKFTMHLGSTGCTATEQMFKDGNGQECTQPNRVDLKFTAFNPEIQKVVLDYKELLTSVDVSKNFGGAAGCMSGLTDPECMSTGSVAGSMFNKLGLDDVGAKGICLSGDCTTNQKLFSVKSK